MLDGKAIHWALACTGSGHGQQLSFNRLSCSCGSGCNYTKDARNEPASMAFGSAHQVENAIAYAALVLGVAGQLQVSGTDT